MQDVFKIKDRFSFINTRMSIWYVILCGGLVFLTATTGYYMTALIAAAALFALVVIVVSIQHMEFGYYAMIVFGFLLAFLDRMTNSALPLYTVIFLAPIGLFVLLIIHNIFYHERLKIDKHPIFYAYFVLFAYDLIQFFNPEMKSTLGWVVYVRQLISNAALLIVSLYLFKNLKSVRFFFRFLLGAIFVTALYGCYQQWVGLTSFELRWLYTRPGALGLLTLPGGGIRKFAFLTDPANFGTLMASGCIGTLILAMESPSKKTKILLSVFTVLIFISVSYSGTRTANIMIAAGLLLYIMLTFYKKRTRVLAVGAGMLFLFIMKVPIYTNVVLHRFRTAFKAPAHDASYKVRLENRAIMKPYLDQHPFGGGLNTTGATGHKYNPYHPLAHIAPDSSLVANYMETGWVGLALHLLFLFGLMAYAVHYYYKCRNPEIKTYYAIIVTILASLGLVGAYAQYTLNNVPQLFLYIPFIAIIIKLHTFDGIKLNSLKN